MTTITILKSKTDEYKGFYCMGHAGYSKKATEMDMVCASVSVLVINTINSLDELVHEEMNVTENQEDGFIKCDFPNPVSDAGKLLIDSMVLGLKSIEQQYGKKYLLVKFKEV